jgi:hypothetical protein
VVANIIKFQKEAIRSVCSDGKKYQRNAKVFLEQ